MCISICEQGLNKFLKFFGSKFQPGDCSWLVLNFWANLSLGVLIKFVLIQKRVFYCLRLELEKPKLAFEHIHVLNVVSEVLQSYTKLYLLPRAIALERKWVHVEKEKKSLTPVGFEPMTSSAI